MMKDYYEILRVPRTAQNADIKRSYRRLAVQYHPDKNQDPASEDLIRDINEAYDVLSDPVKRHEYDQRAINLFTALANEPVAPSHRDPAYRRGTQHRAAYSPKKSSTEMLMGQYLRYVLIVSWAGFILSSLIFVDYILPYHTRTEDIVDVLAVKGRRGGISHLLLISTSGYKIKLYPEDAEFPNLLREKVIIQSTLIFDTPMTLEDSEGTLGKLGYIYRFQLFFVALLFAMCGGSLLFRNRTEMSFNMGVVGAVLMVITLVFL